MAKRELPEINASSLADIAFLLLTFFLVATTLNKPIGMYEKLPDLEKVQEDTKELESTPRNILTIRIDSHDELRVRDESTKFSKIKERVMAHIDNNGKGKCNYCEGDKDPKFSDSPQKAFLQLIRSTSSTYGAKYTVVSSIEAAYRELREKYAQKTYNRSYKSIKDYFSKSVNLKDPNQELVEMYKDIEEKYPFNFSKPDPQDNL